MIEHDRPGWHDQAACAGHEPDLWFPTRGESAVEAVAICLGCPVAGPCLDHALHHEEHGVWGGTSERERRRLRKRLGIRLVTHDPTDDALEEEDAHS